MAGPHQRSELEQAVHAAVEQRQRFSAWPAVLRQAYHDEQEDGARQELRHQQAIGLGVTLLSSGLDWVAIPHMASQGLVLRLALIVPFALMVIVLAPRMKLWHLKLATTYTLVAFAGLVMFLASHGDPATATRYTMATSFLLGMGVLLLPYRDFELAMFAGLFTAVTIIAGLWPNPIPSFLIIEHIVLTALVAGGTLVIALRTGELRRRAFLFGLRDSFAQAELEQNVRILRELSESDVLTGLPNRRAFRSTFDSRFMHDRRGPDEAVTVMMIDLDHFKSFNDRHGHQAGDRALRAVGLCLEECFSGSRGAIARFGGEEFIAAFTSTSIHEAERTGEQVRAAIGALQVTVRHNASVPLSASIGIASTGPGAVVDLGELTARADRALYRAKREGRNRVVVSERIELRVDRLAS
ncbi:MAG: GGDEF domain-containing protein [Sphingomonadaceae bacterium]|nr:GGDEF domain-containing protein [Sphingomonadaceae bacterium]